MNKQKINPDNSVLFVIDIQERLLPTIHEHQKVQDESLKLLKAARELEIPIHFSEQYPKGLGKTVDALQDFLTEENRLEKTHFSAVDEHPELFKNLIENGKNNFILAGIESHICVYQTAKDLLAMGAEVILAKEATGSRNPEHQEEIFHTLKHLGALVLPVESVLFEWVNHSKHQHFKFVSNLIK